MKAIGKILKSTNKTPVFSDLQVIRKRFSSIFMPIFSSNKSYCQQEQKSSDITSQPKRSLKSILKKTGKTR